jgi:hypothetical protein
MFRPEGARNAHAIRDKGSEPIGAVSRGPFRANSGGENLPRVNPGLSSLGHFGPEALRARLRSHRPSGTFGLINSYKKIVSGLPSKS